MSEYSTPPDPSLTADLLAWSRGDEAARDRAISQIERELRRRAGALMSDETPAHTLQPTALVNEVVVRLLSGRGARFEDRAHLLAYAARVMRHVLVDHARARGAAKRGGRSERLTLSGLALTSEGSAVDLLALHQALERLAQDHPRIARVLELHFFGGLALGEIGTALGVSESTACRDRQLGLAWLRRELEPCG